MNLESQVSCHQHYLDEEDKEILSSSDLIHNLSKIYTIEKIDEIDNFWHNKPITNSEYCYLMGVVTRGLIKKQKRKVCPILGKNCLNQL